jgi:hypothetical protein
MKEKEIVEVLVGYLKKSGYEVTTEVAGLDVIAIRDNVTFIIEAKGDQVNTGEAIQIVIGQIISRMFVKAGEDRKYGIAISPDHLDAFRCWGVEGLKLLPIHLFLIDAKGGIEVKSPEEFVRLVEELKSDAYHSLRIT